MTSTPNTVVEIAFDSGYTTPAASRTWTDVTAYVLEASKVGITYGRQDELSLADANQLSLTLNNSDGRFTWGNASSPYYPNVKVGRPIRVRIAEETRTNLAFNPRGISTGYLGEYLARSSWTRSFITGTTGPIADITTAARFTNVTDDVSVTGRGLDIYGSASAAPPGTTGDWIKQPVASGETITISGYVRSSVATTWRMSTRFHDSAGNWVDAAQFGTSVAASANAWVRVSRTATVPAGATHLTARLDNGVSATFPDAATIDATGLLIEKAAAVGDYFDGTTPDGGLTHAWTGTINASTSTQITAAVTNLVPNPSFEVDTVGWVGQVCTMTRSTAQAYVGTASLEMTATGTPNMAATNSTSRFPVTAGASYTAQAQFRAATTARSVRPNINWFDSGGGFISQSTGTTVANTTTGWTQVTVTATAPVGAVTGAFYGLVLSVSIGEVHYVDAVMAEMGSAAGTYFDGDTSDTASFTYSWTGTAHASTSIQQIVAATRYTGFINEWPVEWPGVVTTFATTPTGASSRLSRLGSNSPLKSVVEQEYLRDSPTAYYALSEPTGATQANDSSGNGAAALTQVGSGTAVTFGTAIGPGTDGLTAGTFAGGKYLSATGVAVAGSAVTVECYFSTSTTGVEVILAGLGDSSGARLQIDFMTNTLKALVGGTTLSSPSAVTDGVTHHAAVTFDGTTARLYLDGVEVDDGASSVGTYAGLVVGENLTGVCAHVATSASALSATRIADHYEAGATGFEGETTDERLARYAAWAGIPAAEVVTTASTITLDHIDPTGVQAVEMLRKVETSEAGVLHDDRDGNLRLRTRSARYNAPVAVTLDTSSGQVGIDYRPNVDRSTLYTIGDGQNTDGTITARYTDEADRDNYGDSTYSVTTAAQDDDEPLHLAAWVVNANSSPRPRAPQVTVNLMPYLTAGDITTLAALLALDIGSKVRISNAPSQAPATTADYFVEGYREDIGVSVWSLTLNLSPATPYDDVLILDSATDGLLDTNILAL